MRALVLHIRHQLSRSGRNDAGAWGRRRPIHDLPLGSALCSGDGEADPTLSGISLRLLENGRDLHPRRGNWKYLFRVVDKHGRLIAFMLSDRRNPNTAYCFLRKALRTVSDYPPSSITTDKLASYPKAIRRLQNEGLLSKAVEHRTSKYLTDVFDKPFLANRAIFLGHG